MYKCGALSTFVKIMLWLVSNDTYLSYNWCKLRKQLPMRRGLVNDEHLVPTEVARILISSSLITRAPPSRSGL